jgi:hypothetical protein
MTFYSDLNSTHCLQIKTITQIVPNHYRYKNDSSIYSIFSTFYEVIKESPLLLVAFTIMLMVNYLATNTMFFEDAKKWLFKYIVIILRKLVNNLEQESSIVQDSTLNRSTIPVQVESTHDNTTSIISTITNSNINQEVIIPERDNIPLKKSNQNRTRKTE